MRTSPARRRQEERQRPGWANSKYHPRPSIIRVRANSGHVSTRNAGAKASPAEVPPKRPSKPGTTHHQGNGKRPLSMATKGISTRSNLSIRILHEFLWGVPERRPFVPAFPARHDPA